MPDTTFLSLESDESSPLDPNTVLLSLTVQDMQMLIDGYAVVVTEEGHWPFFDDLSVVTTYRQYTLPSTKERFRVYWLKQSSQPLTFATSATCKGCGHPQDSWMMSCRVCYYTILQSRQNQLR